MSNSATITPDHLRQKELFFKGGKFKKKAIIDLVKIKAAVTAGKPQRLFTFSESAQGRRR
jgi:hypothetical protein